MDDLLNKTKELSNLVSSLKDKGEDNTELQGILAQLQAAVAKRTNTTGDGDVQPDGPATKTEPVEPELAESAVNQGTDSSCGGMKMSSDNKPSFRPPTVESRYSNRSCENNNIINIVFKSLLKTQKKI